MWGLHPCRVLPLSAGTRTTVPPHFPPWPATKYRCLIGGSLGSLLSQAQQPEDFPKFPFWQILKTNQSTELCLANNNILQKPGFQTSQTQLWKTPREGKLKTTHTHTQTTWSFQCHKWGWLAKIPVFKVLNIMEIFSTADSCFVWQCASLPVCWQRL